MSARAFYDPVSVSDFVGKYCKLSDLNRALSDVDRVKVFLPCLYVISMFFLCNLELKNVS